ncbi:STAS/SEC14 domain-containing protein [Arthrobacter sp. HMWF013]|nr:STAS/SEC14 domain-containing protein [Arthrobacter sp. HMWF013]
MVWSPLPDLRLYPDPIRIVEERTGGKSVEPIVVSGGKGRVSLENQEIIHLLWEPKVRIEAADARAAMAAVNSIARDSEYPMLVDMTTTESLSRQARSVFTIRCAASRIALLGTSPVDRILANWSLGVQNLPCPTRFFTSRTEAMKWLLA